MMYKRLIEVFLSLMLLVTENVVAFSGSIIFGVPQRPLFRGCFTGTIRPTSFLASSSSASPAEDDKTEVAPEDAVISDETNGPVADVLAEAAPENTAIISEEKRKKEAVGNLVADDEWAGVTMELSELVKKAVIEDLKANARDFLGKDEYKVGDISKEIDARVKQGVADLRGKDEYEVGDLIVALDEFSKNMTEELTGKPYEFGDLSKEIDSRVKKAVASYVGKDEYEAGDLTRAVADKVITRIEELTENYEFGDISREVERRRKEWVKDFLGEEAAANYKFGDISKKLATKFTGKDEYQFGDISKKIVGDLFGKKKKEKEE